MKGISRISLLLSFLTSLSPKDSVSQLSGTFNVPGNYVSIGAAIADLNVQGVNGAVLITINAGHTETAGVGGYTLTATGTSVNTIAFQKTGIGPNPLITAYSGGVRTPGSASQDGIWHFIGCDYITVNGIDLLDLNAANPATMEYGFGFFKANAADGCQNNTIQNCNITLNRINNAAGAGPAVDGSRGINMVNSLIVSQTSVLTITASTGSHSNNRFYGNTIQNCNIGIALIGFAAPSPFSLADSNNEVGGSAGFTGNTIINFGGGGLISPAAAIRTLAQYNLFVAYNTINNNNGSGLNHGTTLRGIFLNNAQSANVTVLHNTLTVNGGGSNTQVSVIENLSGATAASNSVIIENNLIANCTNANNTSGNFFGIYNNTATSYFLSLSANSFSNNTLLSSGGSIFLVYNNAAIANSIRLNSNLVSGNTFSSSANGIYYGIYNNAISGASLEMSGNAFSNNLRYAGTGASHLVYNALNNSGDISITNNVIAGNTFSLIGGIYYGVYNNGASSGRIDLSQTTFSNNSIYSTSGAVFSIYNTGSTTANTLLNNNVFSSENNSITTTGVYYGIYNNAASANSISVSNNQFQTSQFSAATGSVLLIYNRGPVTTTFSINNMDFNTIQSCTFQTASTSAFTGIYNSFLTSDVLSISNNSISNTHWVSSTSNKYLIINNGAVNTSLRMNNNVISSCTNTLNTSGIFYGLFISGQNNGELRVENNTLTNLVSNASSGASGLIFNNAFVSAMRSFTGNILSNLQFNANGSAEFNGIYNSGSTGSNIELSRNSFTNITVIRSTGASYLIQNTGPVATTIGTVNILNNFVSGYTGSFTANGSFFGLYNNAVSAQQLNINTNTFVNTVNSGSNGATHLLYNRGIVTNTFVSVSFTNNSVSNYSFNSTGTGGFFGIYNNGPSAGNVNVSANTFSTILFNSSLSPRYMIFNSAVSSGSIQLNANLCSNLSGTINTTGLFYLINNTSSSVLGTELNENGFINAQLNATTGNIFYVHNSGFSNASIGLKENVIDNVTVSQTGTGALFGIYNNAASSTSLSISQNTISNCSRTSFSGAGYWIYSGGIGTTLINNCQLNANSLTNLLNTSAGTGPYYAVYSGGGVIGELSILNNTLSSLNWNTVNANRFLIANTALVNVSNDIKQNLISGFTSSLNTTAGLYGIYNAVPPSPSRLDISSNLIENFNVLNSNGVVQLIYSTGTQSSGVVLSANSIRNYTVLTTGSGDVYGIFNASSSSSIISISQNTLSNAIVMYSTGTIYDILNTATSSGSIVIERNHITNHTSSAQSIGGKTIIYNNAAGAPVLSINANTITGIQHNAVNGSVHFIYNRGTLANTFSVVSVSDNVISTCSLAASGVLTNQNHVIFNNGVQCNSLSIQSNTLIDFSWQTALTFRYLIYNTGTSNQGISIRNNVMRNHIAPINSTGNFYGIFNNSPNSFALNIENNTIDQIQSQSTFGIKYLILNSGSLSNSVAISSNSLTNNSILSSTLTSFYGIHNTANTSTLNLLNANVIQSNTASTSNGTMALVLNTGLATQTVNQILISNNTLSDNSFNATLNGPFYGIINSVIASQSLTIQSNLISNQNSPLLNSNRFMYFNSGPALNLISIQQNSLSGISYTNNTTGNFFGINNSASCAGSLQIVSNAFNQLALSSSTGSNYAIFNSGAISVSRVIDLNLIENVSSASSASGTYFGILNQSSPSQFLSMSSNTLSNQAINTSSVPIYLIHNTGLSAVSVNTVQLNSNVISGGLQKTDALAPFYGVFNQSISSQNIGLNNNLFSNHNLEVQQGARYLVYNTSPSTSLSTLNGNQFISNQYSDSLSSVFYGVMNEGAINGQLQMNNNAFNTTTISTKTSSLYLVCNSALSGTGTPAVELNGNNFTANSFSITQNKPLYFVCQNGSNMSGLAMNSNSAISNEMLMPLGSVYMIQNASSVSNTIGLNSNVISANINPTPASGDVFAISNFAAQSQSTSINSNTVTNNQSHHVSGTTNLIFNAGVANSALSLNNNVLNHAFANPSQPYTGAFNGIWISQSGTTAAVNIASNVFSSITFSPVAGLGPLYFIRNSSDPDQLQISNTGFTNLQLRNSGPHYFIYNSGNVQSLLGVFSNTLNNYVRQQSVSGDAYFYYANAIQVPQTCIQTFSSNTISNITSSVSGFGNFYGIYSADGAQGTYPLKSIHNNLMNAITYNSSGDFIGYYANYLGDGGLSQPSSIHNNTISNVNWQGNIFGIYHGTHSSPTQNVLMFENEIYNLNSGGASSSIYPACLNFSSSEIKFYKNKIHSIQANGVSAKAYGIYSGNVNTTEISNNRVGKIFAPNSTVLHPVNGIYVAGGSTVNVYYNTVFLDATSAAPNFNSNALYASTNPQLRLRNNIFINTSIATGTGITAAYRRSSASLATHALNSDRNVYYAGLSSANNFIYYDLSNAVSALFNFQSLFSPREGNSQKENTPFLSTVGAVNTFLMIDPALPSATESGAQNIGGITEDFDSQVRQGNPGYVGTGSAPDIGADEYNQSLTPCTSVNSGTISPASSTVCAGQNITLQSAGFTFTSAGGVIHQWQSSNSGSGPFAAVVGGSPANRTEYTSGALSSGTLFFVMSSTCTNNSQTSVSNQATVIVLPSPTASISASSSTFCSGSSIQLNLSTDIGTTFLWIGPSNYTSSVQSPSLNNLGTFAGGLYSVQVTAANACTNSASYSLQVYPAVPVFSFTPLNPAICSGDSVLVSASIPVSSPTLVFNPQSNQNPANGYPAPYTAYYGGQKMQLVVQASELSASGFVPGSPIHSIEFPVVALGVAWGNTIMHCENFQISVGHTTLSSITAFQSGMNVVLPAYNFTPVVGINSHAFVAPFIWDGQSNLIIETLFSNVIFGSAATSVIQYHSPTGYQSTVVYRADNQSFANIAAATVSNVNVSNARPDFRLNGTSVGNYTWSPAIGLAQTSTPSTQASPSSTQVYTTVLSNGFCSSTNTVLLQVAQHPTLNLVSTANLVCVGNTATLTASGATTYSWSNGASNSVITISPAGNATYVVTGFNQPCPSATAAVQVSVAPALLISAVSQSPILCAGESTTLYANGASTYTWSNGVLSSSTVVSPLVNTTYTVLGSNGPGCSAQQVVTVISNSLPLVHVTPSSTTVCAGVALELIATGALSYTWLPVNLSSSGIVLFPQSSSTYTLVGQAQNQCKSSVVVPVVVDPCLSSTDEAMERNSAIFVYPNPSSGEFTLEFDSNESKTIRLYTVQGTLLFEEVIETQSFRFSISEQAKGFYILKVRLKAGQYNFKLLLQ